MKRYIFGVTIFSLIVGTVIFVTYYFTVPQKQSEVFEPQISQIPLNENINSVTPKIQITSANFDPKIERLLATFACKNTNPNRPAKEGDWGFESASIKCVRESKALHFFEIKKGKAKYLFTQEVLMGNVSTGGDAFTKPTEVESLLKVKSFQNIYVNAEYKNDYKPDLMPTFYPELAVRVEVLQ